jgi:glycine betaine/proline transport system substrate-binding protein
MKPRGVPRVMRRTLAGLSVLLALASAAQAQGQARLPDRLGGWCDAGKPILFAGITWKSGRFYTEMVRQILERGYGCRTGVVEGTSAETGTALNENRLQVWMENWGARDAIPRQGMAEGRIRMVGQLMAGGGVEGWFVPELLVKGDPRRGIKPLAPDLKTVEDLKRYAHLFSPDGQPGSKGLFYNCLASWSCSGYNDQRLKAYGLAESFESYRPASTAALDMLVASAMAVDRPVLFYYWYPAALTAGHFSFVRLEEPAYNDACWKTIANPVDPKPCGSAFKNTPLLIGVSTPFANENPALVALLEKVQLSGEQLSKALFRMTEKKGSDTQEALAFMARYPEAWKAWVPQPVAARILASLR